LKSESFAPSFFNDLKMRIKSKKIFFYFISVFLQLSLLLSCSARRIEEPPVTVPPEKEKIELKEPPQELPAPPGIFHIVKKGENLYRIAKTYGLELSQLAAINDIDDPDKIYTGQPIYIPGAKKPMPVVMPHTKGAPASTELVFSWPVTGEISSYFGEKRRNHYHSGIDIRSPHGTPIQVSRSGVVVFSGHQRGYGRTVIIDHQDGYSTLYAHNSKNLVHVGDRVAKGDIIASVGTSGNASGSHVHFEVRINDNAVDPLPYLP
jgi:murein DD-endopeptidase MepM/ murein hydrolase activator NlpD